MSRQDRDKAQTSGAGAVPVLRQRLDKWLWYARVVKTRSLAARLVGDGHVRLNGSRTDAPAKPVAVGDVLTIALERRVLVLKILGPGERRGPYEEARRLYEDLTPPEPPRRTSSPGERDAGLGRPTKRDRRAIARWLSSL